MDAAQTWRLLHGTEPVGEITVTEQDWPWLSGPFSPRPRFADFAPLFARELALVEAMATDDSAAAAEAWETAYAPITSALRLEGPDGAVAGFLLHIEDGSAWFRWHD
ncbi:hypothetical protein [Murinocardiopsis flavida]|uniref:hypothetical protein n=1 Tax=Murinocardiopsis flavida TaxID=645275 RepID=UPI000D0E2CA6|nr:hypothetical protein [Murinocardiopsis flavida]